MAVNLSWSNGGPQGLIKRITEIPNAIRVEAEVVVKTVVTDAAAYQKQLLEEATTPTGDKRMATGNGPAGATAGRHVTGKMIDDISSDVAVAGDVTTGLWGWANPEPYELAQDFGMGHIPAADSLFNSFVKAEQDFIAGIRDLTQNQGF